ncbi:hypothetical protein RRF57_000510 [Xylaria bambusicola]|uniref:Uncharacterized protein n=1 Tax=Xylaria bambusicola TaxID=326684 RepID=A0AAN7UEP4_9PEZI
MRKSIQDRTRPTPRSTSQRYRTKDRKSTGSIGCKRDYAACGGCHDANHALCTIRKLAFAQRRLWIAESQIPPFPYGFENVTLKMIHPIRSYTVGALAVAVAI